MGFFEVFAWVLLGGGTGVIALLLCQQTRQMAQQKVLHRKELALFEERIKLARGERKRQEGTPAAWNGTRKFRVEKKHLEGGGVCSFYLAPHDGKFPLPEFRPGQFLTFHLEVSGKKAVRCYSLSDCYHPERYRVSIKKLPAPPDQPGIPSGLVSSHFHDNIKEGDILDVHAPSGDFVIDLQENNALVLSGAGVGVTPVLSMMNALTEARSRREVWFFYGVRNRSENILREKIQEWRSLGLENLHVVVCHSHPLPEEQEGHDYDHPGWIDCALFKRILPSNNFDFFTCGPPPMMKAVREGLQAWGVPEVRVHDEAFIQAKQSVAVSDATIFYKKTGRKVALGGQATNLLELAEKEGIDIPYGCKIGHCGTCQTALLVGKVRYVNPPKFQVEAGCCLPCICVPDGDVEIDA